MGMFIHADDEFEHDDSSLFPHTQSEEDKVKELIFEITNLPYKQITEFIKKYSDEIDFSTANIDKIISKLHTKGNKNGI